MLTKKLTKPLLLAACFAMLSVSASFDASAAWNLLCSGNGGAGSSWQQITTTGAGSAQGAQSWDEFKGCAAPGTGSSPPPVTTGGAGGSSFSAAPSVVPSGTSASTAPSVVPSGTSASTTPVVAAGGGSTSTTPLPKITQPPLIVITSQTCPPGTTGVYPNCMKGSAPTPLCPAGTTGVYPSCVTSGPSITTGAYGNRGQGGVSQNGGVSVGGALIGNITIKSNSGIPGSVGGPPKTTTSSSGGATTTTTSSAVTGVTGASANKQIGTLTQTSTTTKPTTTGSYGSASTSSTTNTTSKLVLNTGTTIVSTRTCTTTVGYFASCRTHSGRCAVTTCN